ncbi:MAG: hypothetical protein A2491_07195 [Bacteroidetes bacterium RIFOXYC12_FULL_35_7]|nr:MAG: hypothetical protein A2491_07195 [Bacteroidetes bacterium RIFOXYC12_FULL_35_7]
MQASGTTNGLFSVYFIDANMGYVVGDNGIILNTNNASADWTVQTSNTTYSLYSVYFTDANTGYTVGGGYNGVNTESTILKTINGGALWISQISETTNPLFSVFFSNPNMGYAVGLNGTILKTTNAGNNWATQASGTVNGLNSVYFIDANTGYAVGDGGIILKTTTGGEPTIIVSNTTKDNNLKIYPNPSDDIFTIEFDNHSNKAVLISITDLSGEIVFETTCVQKKYFFFRKALNPGIYIVKILGDRISYGKIVVK